MSETWYRVNMNDEITEVEVEYSTAHFVMIANPHGGKPKRESRDGVLASYFDYRGKAKHYIIMRAKRNMEAALNDLRAAQERLAKVMEEYA